MFLRNETIFLPKTPLRTEKKANVCKRMAIYIATISLVYHLIITNYHETSFSFFLHRVIELSVYLGSKV